MSSPQDEGWLRRLRDRQLATRDPQKKQKQMHGKIARKQHRSVESFSIGRVWSEIPHMWKGAFYGLSVGVLAIAVLPLVWISPWSPPCAAGSAAMLAIIGLFIGRAQDTRDSLRDLTR